MTCKVGDPKLMGKRGRGKILPLPDLGKKKKILTQYNTIKEEGGRRRGGMRSFQNGGKKVGGKFFFFHMEGAVEANIP